MKKRIAAMTLAVVFLVVTLFTFTSCSPYETVQSLTQKMEETQKYTVSIDMDMSMEYGSQGFQCLANIISETDGDKMHVSYDIVYDEENTDLNMSMESYLYLDGNLRKIMSRETSEDEWVTYPISSSDNGLGDLEEYLTIDFDWDKFTEDYFDQDGNTLTLKEEKYVEFFPYFADYIDYFKVTAGFNQFTIEYSMSYDLSLSAFEMIVTMSISNIGTTTVTIPE
ncbi:MAG TPA: hypothetical protein PK675_02300 [Clostridia bacterium]|nr:hypothetical protein [Clostridia bacterium]